jgi:hypothetical protein
MMDEERAANEAPTDDGQDQNYDVLAATTSHETGEGESEHLFVDPGGSQRVYDVAPDGIVEGVRPAEMTPDRGPGVGTTVRQVGDDDGPRFSGAGADDSGSELYAVPSDTEFKGKLYRDAPDLANIAEMLIDRHGFLGDLINCEIRYYWRRKTGVSKGRVKIGYCKRASDLLGHFSGADFIVWLSATTARDGKFTPRQVEAAIFHQLLHIETDDQGNFISARHDFEGFAQEIRHYGTWTEDLKLVVPAVDAARQMGLFDVDDEGIEDDDDEDEREEAARAGYVEDPTNGAGVLIHADGTALTDDEIEAMERHELNDDPYEQALYGEPDTSGELPTGEEIDAARAEHPDILLDDPAAI